MAARSDRAARRLGRCTCLSRRLSRRAARRGLAQQQRERTAAAEQLLVGLHALLGDGEGHHADERAGVSAQLLQEELHRAHRVEVGARGADGRLAPRANRSPRSPSVRAR